MVLLLTLLCLHSVEMARGWMIAHQILEIKILRFKANFLFFQLLGIHDSAMIGTSLDEIRYIIKTLNIISNPGL